MLDKIRDYLKYIILLEYIIIIILLTINIYKLKDKNNKLKDKNNKLKEDIKETNIKCKMYYEDILQILEK